MSSAGARDAWHSFGDLLLAIFAVHRALALAPDRNWDSNRALGPFLPARACCQKVRVGRERSANEPIEFLGGHPVCRFEYFVDGARNQTNLSSGDDQAVRRGCAVQ